MQLLKPRQTQTSTSFQKKATIHHRRFLIRSAALFRCLNSTPLSLLQWRFRRSFRLAMATLSATISMRTRKQSSRRFGISFSLPRRKLYSAKLALSVVLLDIRGSFSGPVTSSFDTALSLKVTSISSNTLVTPTRPSQRYKKCSRRNRLHT